MRHAVLALLALIGLVLGRPASAAAAAGPPAPAGHPLEQADLEAWADGAFPYALQQGDIAGAVIVVVKDGQVLFEKGYGYADVARRTPMDPRRTILGVGSVSKTFVWTAVMQLVAEGKLDLDRDVNAYLDVRIPPAFGKPITLRNLMTHSAGFNARAFRNAPAGARPRDLTAYIRGTPIPDRIYPPGTVPAYSNYGAMLAGYIVERVSGERFVDYIQHHIIDPLGMASSTFRRPLPPASASRLSQSYELGSGAPAPSEDREEPVGDPSGHLTTTADDIARFMIAHLQDGRYGAAQILKPETAVMMHSALFRPAPVVKGMALGFFRMDRNGHAIIGHPGDIASFHTDMEMLVHDGVGIFIGLNSDGVTSGPLSVGNTLRFALAQQFMDRYFPAPVAPEPPTLSTAKQDAQRVAGEYWVSQKSQGNFQQALELIANYFSLHLNVTANPDGTLQTPAFASFITGRPETWREVAPNLWRQVGGPDEMHVLVDDGRVRAFATGDVIAAFVFQRVPAPMSAWLNVSLLLAAGTILIISLVMWPVGWLVRRSFGRPLELSGRERIARLVAHGFVIVAALYALAWPVALSLISTAGNDHWIRLAQAIGLLCVAGMAAAWWNAWLTLSGRRGWWAKPWSVAMALAFTEIVWFSFVFHLITWKLNY